MIKLQQRFISVISKRLSWLRAMRCCPSFFLLKKKLRKQKKWERIIDGKYTEFEFYFYHSFLSCQESLLQLKANDKAIFKFFISWHDLIHCIGWKFATPPWMRCREPPSIFVTMLWVYRQPFKFWMKRGITRVTCPGQERRQPSDPCLDHLIQSPDH